MMKQILLILSLLFAASFANAQSAPADIPQIVYDSSDTDVPLNITFNGKDILIYGAVSGTLDDDPDLIVSVTGPNDSYTVYEKVHKYGMWINGPSIEFRRVPSFLAIFSDAPLDTIILPTEKQRYKIGFQQSLPIRGMSSAVDDPKKFVDAFVNIERRKSNYVLDEDGVKVLGNVLFSARIPLAADIVEGNYVVDIYLLNRGRVITSVTSDLPVYKSGIERWLYDLAHEHGMLYGLLAIFLAISVAFAASQFMRLFKR